MEPTVPAQPATANGGRVAPAPPAMRLVGWRGNAVRFFRDPLTFLTDLRESHGPVARLAAGGNGPLFAGGAATPATYFVFGGECNREVLSDAEVFQTRTPPGPSTGAYELLSTNVLFTNGGRHTHLRQLLRPAFTRESLKTYHRTMVAHAAEMLDGWRGARRVEADRETMRLALRIASQCFYGVDPTAREGSLASLMHRMVNTLFSPAAVLKVDLPGTPYRRLILTMDSIVEALRAEIERKRAAGAAGEDVLSVLVREHDRDPAQLTEGELLGNAFVLFLGGHETVSTSLIWTLVLLSQHPRVAAQLAAELEDELGGEPPAYEQLYDLPVLDRVIKESLRLLPPGIFFPRVATRTTRVGGYEVPGGSEVVYSPYVTHRDPEIFPEPKRFLPDRWLECKPTPFEYLPFGARAHTCMGVSFAGMQLRIVLPMILQRYRLELVPGTRVDVKSHTVMSPRRAVPMNLRPPDSDARRAPRIEGHLSEIVDFDGA